MRFLSVCSGVQGRQRGTESLGWKAVHSMVNPSLRRAGASPGHAQLGRHDQISKSGRMSAIDLLCGEEPPPVLQCRVTRKGLDDPRGNLMLTYLAIAAKYRPVAGLGERPGVLSSGEDGILAPSSDAGRTLGMGSPTGSGRSIL